MLRYPYSVFIRGAGCRIGEDVAPLIRRVQMRRQECVQMRIRVPVHCRGQLLRVPDQQPSQGGVVLLLFSPRDETFLDHAER